MELVDEDRGEGPQSAQNQPLESETGNSADRSHVAPCAHWTFALVGSDIVATSVPSTGSKKKKIPKRFTTGSARLVRLILRIVA